jgi:RimJ/RimL family protein N-acetyltransferase
MQPQTTPTMDIRPIVLEGRYVRLEPLATSHAEDLLAAAGDPEIWRWMPAELTTPERIAAWMAEAHALQQAGSALPFAIVDVASGRAIGSTRYLNIVRRDRGLEIGWTWLGPAYWRTAVNSECKLLLLSHAFDTLGCIRVQIKTDRRNERSRRAIERLGAQLEGILRNHMIQPYGLRDSAMYSIVVAEWPAVRQQLRAGLYG